MKSYGRYVTRTLLALSVLLLVITLWKTHEARDLLRRNATAFGELKGLREQVAESAAAIATLKQELANSQSAAGSAGPGQSGASKALSDDDMDRAKAAAIAEARRRGQIMQLIHRERYLHPKFDQLGLTSAQWEEYGKLESTLQQELNATSRSAAGATQARARFEQAASELVGPEAARALHAFRERLERATRPAGIAARELQDALRFSAAPLNAAQAEQFASLVDADMKSASPYSPPVLSPAAAAQMQGFLSPAQREAWRRLGSVYGATAELNELMRKHAGARAQN